MKTFLAVINVAPSLRFLSQNEQRKGAMATIEFKSDMIFSRWAILTEHRWRNVQHQRANACCIVLIEYRIHPSRVSRILHGMLFS
jgi:hypothetical protein